MDGAVVSHAPAASTMAMTRSASFNDVITLHGDIPPDACGGQLLSVWWSEACKQVTLVCTLLPLREVSGRHLSIMNSSILLRLSSTTPGVSSSTIWLSSSDRMPRMRCRVVCGLYVTMDSLAPTTAFISVLLPALGRPTMATYLRPTNPGALSLRRRPPPCAAPTARGHAHLDGVACELCTRRHECPNPFPPH